jgi:hypothetical protein
MWTVPREWIGDRCFILCSGESLQAQRPQIAQLRGRIVGVKHGMLTRPDCDVFFMSGERCGETTRELLPHFRGGRFIQRGRADPDMPADVLRVGRHKQHDRLRLDLPQHVGGYDTGTSAIHLAALFGATEIVILGMDMTGGHFVPHPLQYPPQEHFRRHMGPLAGLAADAAAKGIRIVNCSPISKVDAFERRPLEDFL